MASEPFSGVVGDPAALEALRRTLVDETSTYRGFCRRVKIKTVQQVAGLALPALVLLLASAVYGTWSTLGADDGASGSAWERLAGSSAVRSAVRRTTVHASWAIRSCWRADPRRTPPTSSGR